MASQWSWYPTFKCISRNTNRYLENVVLKAEKHMDVTMIISELWPYTRNVSVILYPFCPLFAPSPLAQCETTTVVITDTDLKNVTCKETVKRTVLETSLVVESEGGTRCSARGSVLMWCAVC